MKLKFKVAMPGKKPTIGTLELDPQYNLCQSTIDGATRELIKLGYQTVIYLGYLET